MNAPFQFTPQATEDLDGQPQMRESGRDQNKLFILNWSICYRTKRKIMSGYGTLTSHEGSCRRELGRGQWPQTLTKGLAKCHDD